MQSKYFGIYQGKVVSVSDPEKRGRIKVICPEVLYTSVSAWCDPCIPVAYDGGGDFCLPKMGEAVWLMFISGDANKPVYLGGWWSKDSTPINSNYSSDKRIINYANCTITLKDGKISLKVDNSSNNEVIIQTDKMTIKGNLVVEGEIITPNKEV